MVKLWHFHVQNYGYTVGHVVLLSAFLVIRYLSRKEQGERRHTEELEREREREAG